MSRTTALGVIPYRRPTTLAEFRNASGWSPSIWTRLLREHGVTESWLSADADLDRLWHSIEDLPDWQQAPLVLTFDTGVIPHTEFGWAADRLDEFERRCPELSTRANHVPALVELLRSLPETPLLGMWGTSVSENPFDPWDEERDEPGSGIAPSEMYALPQHREQLTEMFDN